VSAALLAILGTALAFLFNPGRIPVTAGQIPPIVISGFWDVLHDIFSIESMRNPGQEGSILLFLVVPAFLLGWHFHHDKEIAEPSFNLFDSLSRILYRMNRYILILMPFFLGILVFHTSYTLRTTVNFQPFMPLLRRLLYLCIIFIAILFPLALWLLGREKSPLRTLRSLSGVFLGAFISASMMFNYGNLTLHLKEKLKIQRQMAALAAPIHLMLTRGGTALISAICMITIIRSYSSLEITFFQAAWTAFFSFLVSFVLAAAPDHGLITSLVILGNLYGRGLENGWSILTPIIPLLIMVCSLLDTATIILILILTNKQAGIAADTDLGLYAEGGSVSVRQ
ncbi:MAG: hypothetical protein B6D68_00130, partial [spirochete symbiont of Stewartia floridana]